MSSTPIKPGTDIVNDFLTSLESDSDIDADTLEVIRQLVSSESLTATRISQGLEFLRKAALAPDKSDSPDEDHDS